MLKLNKIQQTLELVNNEFKMVNEDIDINRIKEKTAELLKSKYRYTSIMNDNMFLEIKHICKVSSDEYEPLFEKVKSVGNQTLVKYENYYFENKEPIYFIVGCTGLIAGLFMIENKLYVIKRSEIAPINIEFYEEVVKYISEKYHITEYEVEEIEETDETRKDYGIKQNI